jgi:hypothetical protein
VTTSERLFSFGVTDFIFPCAETIYRAATTAYSIDGQGTRLES